MSQQVPQGNIPPIPQVNQSKKLWQREHRSNNMRTILYYSQRKPERIIAAFRNTNNGDVVSWCLKILNIFKFMDIKPDPLEYETNIDSWILTKTGLTLDAIEKGIQWDNDNQIVKPKQNNGIVAVWFNKVKDWRDMNVRPPFAKITLIDCNAEV